MGTVVRTGRQVRPEEQSGRKSAPLHDARCEMQRQNCAFVSRLVPAFVLVNQNFNLGCSGLGERRASILDYLHDLRKPFLYEPLHLLLN